MTTVILALCLFSTLPPLAGGGLLEAIDLGKQERTLADIRSLATAVQSYAIDHEQFPSSASVESLEEVLVPTYILRIPTEDAWGNTLRYHVWQEGDDAAGPNRFRIASPGKDGVWEVGDLGGYKPAETTEVSADIVFSGEIEASGELADAGFLRAPDWLFRSEEKRAVRQAALAPAEVIDSAELLKYELDWARREVDIVGQIRPRVGEFRQELTKLGKLEARIEVIVPPEPRIGSYLERLSRAARDHDLTFESSGLEIVEHDQHQEITFKVSVRGERAERFRVYGRRFARLAAWGTPVPIDSGFDFMVSIFAVPAREKTALRRCRPVRAGFMPSDGAAEEMLKELASLCEELSADEELRVVYREYGAVKDRMARIIELVQTHRPETADGGNPAP